MVQYLLLRRGQATSLPLSLWHILILVHDNRVLDNLLGFLGTKNVTNFHALVLVLLVVLKEAPAHVAPALRSCQRVLA